MTYNPYVYVTWLEASFDTDIPISHLVPLSDAPRVIRWAQSGLDCKWIKTHIATRHIRIACYEPNGIKTSQATYDWANWDMAQSDLRHILQTETRVIVSLD